VNGKRPVRPRHEDCQPKMTDIMWQLIEDAWQQDPATRPLMIQLEKRLRPANTLVMSNWGSFSGISRHRLSHRELVRLSIPPERTFDNGPLTPRNHITPLFTSPNVSVHSLLHVTPMSHNRQYDPSLSPEPWTNWKSLLDAVQDAQTHIPTTWEKLDDLEGEDWETVSSISSPTRRGGLESLYIANVLKRADGSASKAIQASDQPLVTRHQHHALSSVI
jgi:hypothetical protein